MFDPMKAAQNAEIAKDVSSILASGGECTMELKLDGFRLLAWVTESGTRTFTRTGNEQTGKLPQIERELAKLPVGTWIDGEIVAIRMREDGSVEHHWGGVQTVMGSNVDRAAQLSGALSYSVFDVLAIDGKDARSLPFRNRRALLESIFTKFDFEAVVLTPQMAPSDAALAAIIDLGFEGAIVKRLDAPYASGKRGRGWWKIKAIETVDAVIMGYQPGEGKYDGQLGALLLGQYDADGALVQIAKCSGMTDAERLTMSQDPGTYIGTVVEFRHMGQMPSGGYRHPVFARLRDDKAAIECVTA